MNIYLSELKGLRNHIFIWTFILILFLMIFMCMYPAFYSSKDLMIELLKTLPDDVLKALGINIETIFTPLGFYCYVFTYINIIGAFQAGVLGLRSMINDTIEGSVEFLFTKPITRRNLLKYKTLSTTTILLITNLIYQAVAIILMLIISGPENVNIGQLILINTGLLLIQLTFMTICMVIGAYIKKPKAIVITSFISIIAFYILSIIENLLNNVILRYINPFSYFKASDIINNGGYNKSFIIASIFIIIFCLNFSFCSYEQDDIGGN